MESVNWFLVIFRSKHTYLHSDYTTSTIPQGNIPNIHIYIQTTQQVRYPRETFQTYIFTFRLHNKYDTPGKHSKHTYLHSDYTTSTIPQGNIPNIHIYIQTTQQVRYLRETFQTYIFTFRLHNKYDTSQKHYNSLKYIVKINLVTGVSWDSRKI